MRFWQLEVPFAMPRADLEHDDVDVGRLVLRGRVRGDQRRPYHHGAARHRLLHRAGDRAALLPAIGWAIATMLIVILLYDQLLFRPLVAWGDRFRVDQVQGAPADLLGARDAAALAPAARAVQRCSTAPCAGAVAPRGRQAALGANRDRRRSGNALATSIWFALLVVVLLGARALAHRAQADRRAPRCGEARQVRGLGAVSRCCAC